MVPAANVPSPYYSGASFTPLCAVAVCYSIVSQLSLYVLRPLGIAALPPPFEIIPHNEKKKKVAIVTGSNTGIGYETVKGLVQAGYEVVVACRSRDKAEAAIAQICTPSASEGKAIFVHPLDLSSLKSVREFSKVIKDKYADIDILINNAGRNTNTGACPDNDKLEVLFCTNFLGHFCLTQQLESLIRKAKGKVINLASTMHHFCDEGVNDETYWKNCALREKSAGTTPDTYSASKLAAILFTLQLRQRGIRSMAVNPGSVNSDIWRTFPRFIIPIFSLVYLNNQQGSICSLSAALLPDEDFVNDEFYLQPYWQPSSLLSASSSRQERCVFPVFEMLGPFAGCAVPVKPRLPVADDGGAASQALWNASEQLTRCKFSQ